MRPVPASAAAKGRVGMFMISRDQAKAALNQTRRRAAATSAALSASHARRFDGALVGALDGALITGTYEGPSGLTVKWVLRAGCAGCAGSELTRSCVGRTEASRLLKNSVRSPCESLLELAAGADGGEEGAFVEIVEFAADRHALSEAGERDAGRLEGVS